MTTLTVNRLNQLREYAKQRINRDINKTLDDIFDIIESTLTCNTHSKMPPGLMPLGGIDEIFASINGQTNHPTDDCSPQKKPFDSIFNLFQSDNDCAISGSNCLDAELNIFNNEELKKIFENVSPNLSSATSDFDCESDNNQNCSSTGSSFSEDDLMAQINYEVFAHNNKAPLQLSSSDNSPSPSESHFVVPLGVESTLGPITPPKKLAQNLSGVNSFAKVAAASAAKSLTKTAKTDDQQFLIPMTGKSKCLASAKTKIVENIDHFKANHSQNHAKNQNVKRDLKVSTDEEQFLVIYINCIIPHCMSRLHNQHDLNNHLEKTHSILPVLCPINGCTESFKYVTQLDGHVFITHGSTNYNLHCSLPDCNFRATGHRQLSSHIYWYHNEGLFKCSKCTKTGKTRSEMTRHYSEMHQA